MRRPWNVAATVTGAVAVVTAGSLVAATPAQAAVACRVDYVVTSQWPGGFVADVRITNLGDPLSGWNLTWSFTAGERVTSGWNATLTQSGGQVGATNAGWNGSVATYATASFGFQGTTTGPAAVPGAFALNGTACTGSPTGTTTVTTTSVTRTSTTTRATTTTTRATTTTTRATTTTTRATTTSATTTRAVTGTPPASYPGPGVVTGAVDAHDPTVVRMPAGGYLLAHTGNDLVLKTSTDRTAWRNAGTVFPGGASWTFPFTANGRNLWAPDLSYLNGQYWMYYSASTFGSNNSAIFLATSPTGATGTWTNRGQVIASAGQNWNAIDPNLVVDASGTWWLSFGSFWSGIKLVRINPSTGMRADSTMYSIAARSGGTTAIEAPVIFRHGGYYYLFVSWDTCCQGSSSTYRIMVGRSTSITGPYLDRNGTEMARGGGTQVLAGHGSIHGPGHQAVINDADGDVLFYHYYTDSGAARLGINLLGWDSAGWPYVY